MSNVTVLYVGGVERSGSTLLDRMLGQIPGLCSAGEIKHLWKWGLLDNSLCGCGRSFLDCPFWTSVGREAFGGWDKIDGEAVLSLAGSVDRQRYVPLLGARGSSRFAARAERYRAILSSLYSAIREVSGEAVVVDSSNAVSSAYLLRTTPGVDLRVVHLVRDSRGVAFSWTKRVARPDVTERTVYMDRYPPYVLGMRWVTSNLAFEALGRMGVPMVRLRYESLVRQPRTELSRILAGSGIPYTDRNLSFISPAGAVELAVNHTVMGNPMRMTQGPLELRVDDDWKTSMPRTQQALVTALTWPLLRRYRGHSSRGEPGVAREGHGP